MWVVYGFSRKLAYDCLFTRPSYLLNKDQTVCLVFLFTSLAPNSCPSHTHWNIDCDNPRVTEAKTEGLKSGRMNGSH